MKAGQVITLALGGAAMLVLASSASTAGAKSDQKICTQVKPRSGSRVNQRLCFTEAQWREKLGADWQQIISGSDVPADLDALSVKGQLVDGPPLLPPSKRGSPE